MWVWKSRTKWGTMVLLGILERKSSISYPEHKKIQQTTWNSKRAKNKDIQGIQWCGISTRKTIMHTVALNTPTANI